MATNTRFIKQSFVGGEMSPTMFQRVEDASFQSGAAEIRNMLIRPQGAAVRRGGSRLVAKTHVGADGDSARARLFPFRYSESESFCLEFSEPSTTYVGDDREVGYIRFHSEGKSLLYATPPAWVPPVESSATPYNASADNRLKLTAPLVTAGAQKWATGDAVRLSIGTTTAVSGSGWQSSNDYALNLGVIASDVVSVGSRLLVTNDGAVPPEITPFFAYYVVAISGSTVSLAATRNGPPIQVSSSLGNVAWAALGGSSSDGFDLDTTLYIRLDASHLDEVRFYPTKPDALASTNQIAIRPVTATSVGATATIRMHRAYEPGDFVYGSNTHVFYAIKKPEVSRSGYVYPSDHTNTALYGDAKAQSTWWPLQGVKVPVGGGTSLAFSSNSVAVITMSPQPVSGDLVRFPAGTLPPELDSTATYQLALEEGSTNRYKLLSQEFGQPLEFSVVGSVGAAEIEVNPYYELPHFYSWDELQKLSVTQSFDVVTLAVDTKPLQELVRFSSTRWVLRHVPFSPSVNRPQNVRLSVAYGEGYEVSATTSFSYQLQLNSTVTHSVHPFGVGEVVFAYGFPSGSVYPKGFYTVSKALGSAGAWVVELSELDSGLLVNGYPTSTSVTGFLQSSAPSAQTEWVYQVTAVDEDGVETEPRQSSTSVEVNLAVPGSSVTVTWDEVENATLYRIYKKFNGLFGYIGEVEAGELSFFDDNIGPDFSVTPPIRDTGLRKARPVESVNVNDQITLRFASDDLVDGDPVCVLPSNTNNLPFGSGITFSDYSTTWYIKKLSDRVIELYKDPYLTEQVTGITSPPAGANTYLVAGNFPATAGYYDQRRVMGGGVRSPQDLRLSSAGSDDDLTYSVPVVDSDRIYVRVATRLRSAIRHVLPLDQLLVLTESSELRVSPVNNDVLTPNSISIRPQSYAGASKTPPVFVNNLALFVGNRGGHIRQIFFQDVINGYLTGDLSIRATHLFDGEDITQLDYGKAPYPTVYALSTANKLLALAYVPEQNIAAWSQLDFGQDGLLSVAVVPEQAEDRVYICVQRGDDFFVEQLAPQDQTGGPELQYYMDSGGSSLGGTAGTTFYGLWHLVGSTVTVKYDGKETTAVVGPGGKITLPAPATNVHAGLAMQSQLKTLPLAMPIQAAGYGRTKNIGNVHVRVENSGTFRVGPSPSNTSLAWPASDTQLRTESVEVVSPGGWTSDGQVYVVSSGAQPLRVVGLVTEVSIGG